MFAFARSLMPDIDYKHDIRWDTDDVARGGIASIDTWLSIVEWYAKQPLAAIC